MLNPFIPSAEESRPASRDHYDDGLVSDTAANQDTYHSDSSHPLEADYRQLLSICSSSRMMMTISVDEDSRSLVFHQPPTTQERTVMSLLKIHGYFLVSLPHDQQISALVHVIHFLRACVGCIFSVGGSAADNDMAARAALRWLESSSTDHMTSPQWQEIEYSLLGDRPYSEFVPQIPGSSDLEYSLLGDRPYSEFVPQIAGSSFLNPVRRPSDVADQITASRKRSSREDLEEELSRVQKRVKRSREYDVIRGKGQGVKNANGKFYTPLVRSRALEYSAIDTGNKSRNDELKHSIAVEILIRLAEQGGRILAEDNKTVLENSKAVKKVQSALKDKAREMRRKGDQGSHLGPSPTFDSQNRTSATETCSTTVAADTIESIEPEAYNGGADRAAEGQALNEFSRYWFRHNSV